MSKIQRPQLCQAAIEILLKLESSAKSSASSSQTHPLLIPVILSELFEHVRVEDLRSVRLVCKAWESSSRPRWRSKVRLVIDGERLGRRRNPGVVCHVREHDQRTPFMAFLQLLHDRSEGEHKLNSIPFSNICVRDDDGSTLLIPFFQLYGAHIKDLQLITGAWNWNGNLELDFKRIILHLTPNLRKLTVKGGWPGSLGFIASGINTFPEHEHLQVFHVDMAGSNKQEYSLDFGFWLRHFPNIKTLKVRGLDQAEADQRSYVFWDNMGGFSWRLAVRVSQAQAFQRLLDLMTKIAEVREEFPNKLKLAHLDILDAMLAPLERIEPLVDLLRRATLPLTTLKIDLGLYTQESVVHELLQLHSTTLQSLHCFKGGSPYATIYRNFLGNNVTYPNLREIILGGVFFGLNFNFLRSTPSLEILKHSEGMTKAYGLWSANIVLNFKFEFTDSDMDMDMVRLEGLKELSGRFTIDNPAWFRKVATWMPNLEKLDVPLSKDAFPVVCECWGGTLRELTIRQTFSNVDDEVLTGIPRGWPTRHSRFSLNDQPANITDLKVLERFNDFNPDSRSVSNHSVCWGFLHLPRLAAVFVNVPKETVNISRGNHSNLRKKRVTLKFRQVTDENV